ncbi:MAG: hypothetical protein B7Y50_05815 [Hydrogenophilales bacterium 28-61-11]|nr:MAG: hypothetical protein B7Y50_05815 [Hydrogenophilales bacterium 28-61-11]OYZ58517.1 MAG: hypothetical protein B7Y21_02760 [Hydrogenophilales bacterium 16-61-112]OZA49350.1 MAG: hypothetical protein B7X81_02435 [Hydrogenophilales bacterium 17-61-76]
MSHDTDPHALPLARRSSLHPAAGAAWRWVSERGVLLATGDATLARYAALSSRHWPEVEDLVPADGTLLLILRPGAAMSAALRQALCADATSPSGASGVLHPIRVEYGGVAGPDLDALAARAGLSRDAYINSHTAVEYRVAFLGFQPGFAYLQGLPAALHVPRRASPRVRVPAGSVAIGGVYCGIYPASGPGGWHLIGRAAVTVFDPLRPRPALLLPGDRVRFVAA